MSKCFFNRPTVPESRTNRSWKNAADFSPLWNSFRNSLVGDESIHSCISELLLVGRPVAVFFLVISIVVPSINAVLFAWAWPHVGIKQLEATAPTIAYCDATPTVVPEFFAPAFLVTSPNHTFPNCVLRAMAQTVNGGGPYDSLDSQTSARLKSVQSILAYRAFCSTRTTVDPMSWFVRRFSDHCNLSEYCILEVAFSHTEILSLRSDVGKEKCA